MLDPRAKALRRFLRDITLRGDGPVLSEMIVVEGDGDTTTTRFDEIVTDYRFSESELEAAFPAPQAADAAGNTTP